MQSPSSIFSSFLQIFPLPPQHPAAAEPGTGASGKEVIWLSIPTSNPIFAWMTEAAAPALDQKHLKTGSFDTSRGSIPCCLSQNLSSNHQFWKLPPFSHPLKNPRAGKLAEKYRTVHLLHHPCSLTTGSLLTWNTRNTQKLANQRAGEPTYRAI